MDALRTMMPASRQHSISRRAFSKGSLGVLGAAALSGAFLDLTKHGLSPAVANEGDSEGTWVKSFCSSCIFSNCGTEVCVKDGVAVEIRGNVDHPANQGTLCPRGGSQLMSLYNPYRPKAPMKRTNPEKGLDVDPGWVEITWDEAYQIIEEKLGAILADDPRKFAYLMGFAAQPHENCMAKILTDAFGTTNLAVTSGPLCEVHYAPKTFSGTYIDRVDYGYCDYLVMFGRNAAGSAVYASGPSRSLADAIERGMEIVWVDPHASIDASKGQWVPIKPGTDMAMGMAMLHVMLIELDEFDREAVKRNSNATYLIGPDGDYVRDAASGKPLVWDEAAGAACPFDEADPENCALEGTFEVNGSEARPALVLLKESVSETTPEWAEERSGVSAQTIRRITSQLIEKAQFGATTVIDGRELPLRPAAVAVGRGCANQPQGRKLYEVANIINVLLGGMNVPGSVLPVCANFGGGSITYDVVDGLIRPVYQEIGGVSGFSIPQESYHCLQFAPFATFPMLASFLRAVVDPEEYYLDYDLEALLIYGSNPHQSFTDPDLVSEAFRKIPFIFTVSYHIDEAALFADVVLPEHQHYERNQSRVYAETMAVSRETIGLYGVNYKENVLERPVYDSRQFEDIILDLFWDLGVGMKINAIFNGFHKLAGTEYALEMGKRYTYREMLDHFLRAQTKDPEKGADWFKENGFFHRTLPLEECYVRLKMDGKARMPVYDQHRLAVGRELKANLDKFGVVVPGLGGHMDHIFNEYTPVPEWEDSFLTRDAGEYDLLCVNWKTTPNTMGLGGQQDNAWLLEVVGNTEIDNFSIQINTATAVAKGLVSGDVVRVESEHGGSLEGRIITTELIHPECIGFPGNGGRVSAFLNPAARQGCNYNRLLSSAPDVVDADASAVPLSAHVKVTKIEGAR